MNLQCTSFCYLFCFPTYATEALEDQGQTQGSGTGKVNIFPVTGNSRGCRECSAPTLVTTKEGYLHGRSAVMGVASQITLIGRRFIMR